MRRMLAGVLVVGVIGPMVAVVSVGVTGVVADEPVAAAQAIDADAVDQWVRELDADSFLARERATEKLIEAGESSIAPLLVALRGSSLEVSTRGVYVLREIALTGKPAAQDKAQLALREIAKAKATAAARLASGTLTVLDGIRQERALQQLRKHGVTVSRTHRSIGTRITEVLAVEIGDGFVGEPEDLEPLRWVVDAREIGFSGERVTDDWLRSVSELTGLEKLVLNRTRVTARGMGQIEKLNQLIELDVKYSPVGDGAVEHLKKLTRLEVVKLYGTKMTKAAAAELKVALAAADIDHRNGAFLGVGCQQPPLPCAIIQVQPNSAASRAGLQEGDVVVQYKDTRVTDFDGLKKLIGGNKAGDSVDIRVARGGTTLRRDFTYRKEESLGLTTKKNLLGLEVIKVQPKSLGERLGFKAGDVVTSFAGTPVSDPKQLDDDFTKNQGDDQGSFEFVRDVQLLEKKITFGEWD